MVTKFLRRNSPKRQKELWEELKKAINELDQVLYEEAKNEK